MSTALAPKVSATQTGEWYTAHDYRTHGEVADFVVIMTYGMGLQRRPADARLADQLGETSCWNMR